MALGKSFYFPFEQEMVRGEVSNCALQSERGKGCTHPQAGSYLLNFHWRLPGNSALRLKDIPDNGTSQSPHAVTFGQGVIYAHSPDLRQFVTVLSGEERRAGRVGGVPLLRTQVRTGQGMGPTALACRL